MNQEALLEYIEESTTGLSAAQLFNYTNEMQPYDIATVLNQLDSTKLVKLFRLLSKSIASDVFVELDADKQQEIIETLTDAEQSFIINDLFADDAADLIEEMPADVVTRLLKNANEQTRSDINHLLKYEENTAGSIMTTEFVTIKENEKVGDVFKIIKEHGIHKKTIYTCYVTDSKKTLLGYVSVKDLIFAEQDQPVGNLMHDNVVSLKTRDDYNTISSTFTNYGFVALPIVDSENRLVGLITVDDILELMQEDQTEELQKMAAVKPSDLPYLKQSVFSHSRNRVLWLMLLMVSAMLTGSIISGFEAALVAVPALMAYVPMLMGTGGNAGSQASTQIIRGMALGEIRNRDVLKVLWKEVRVALLCGIAMGVINFLRIILFEGTDPFIIKTAVTVTLSICCTVVMAKSLGCLLPMLAKMVKIDPAIMAAPLIATVLDALSLLVYFGIATMLLL